MRLIAIANILNGVETVGFRILDVDTITTKDVPIGNIESVIQSGNVQIDNLEFKSGKVIGSNGSIERLPKIIGGQLVGKSPLIVISQIGEIGYRVTDYKGTVMNIRSSEIISYAKENGIANGKVVSKDGEEFISSITGNYVVDTIESASKRNNSMYTGELLEGKSALKPILCCITNKYANRVQYKLVQYNNGVSTIQTDFRPKNVPERADIIKGDMYETEEYTLYGSLDKKLTVRYNRDKEKIAKLLGLKNFRESIEDSIKAVPKHRYGCKIDMDTGLVIPSESLHIRYTNVVAEENMDESQNIYNKIPKDEVDNYLKKLAVMKVAIVHKIGYNYKKVALSRKCTTRGVNYTELSLSEEYSWHEAKEVYLEDIFYKHEDYENVVVDGNIMTIRGLDGVYRYNMERINNTYNRFILQNNKNVKAKLLGKNFTEAVNASGELKDYTCQGKILGIPESVRVVHNKSILLQENTNIVFGENIIECGDCCFKNEYINTPRGVVEYVEIGCTGNAAKGIIKSLSCIKSALKDNIVINFKYSITPENYVDVLSELKEVVEIQCNGRTDYIDDSFISRVIEHIITVKLCRLRVLKKPISIRAYSNGVSIHVIESTAFRKLMYNFSEAIELWKKIKHKATSALQFQINGTFEDIDKQIRFREREMNDNKDKMYAEYESRKR